MMPDPDFDVEKAIKEMCTNVTNREVATFKQELLRELEKKASDVRDFSNVRVVKMSDIKQLLLEPAIFSNPQI